MFIRNLLIRALDVYSMIIIIRVIFSWFIANPQNTVYQVLINLTEPVLGPIRKQLVRYFPRMMLDFSPIIVIFLIEFLKNILMR